MSSRILIIDDHPVYRIGLRRLIDAQPDLETVAEADTAQAARDAVRKAEFDAIILDISLPDGLGLQLCQDLRAVRTTPVLVVSMHDETIYAERALRAGASGYVMKHESPDRIIDALRGVIQGEVRVSATVMSRVMRGVSRKADGPSVVASLSNRELEIFEMFGAGLRTREIAERLHISVKTVETHRSNIRDKLELADGNAVFRAAVQWVTTGGKEDVV